MLGLVAFQPDRQVSVEIVPDHHDRAAELDVCADEQVAVVLPGEALAGAGPYPLIVDTLIIGS
ncbi:hypothetical protein TNCT6_03220 [Streptomyces sp. 6-11-2]|nr:hypothetical protein TNCT6_03220 [Streptomyces sp. 6-11-2]